MADFNITTKNLDYPQPDDCILPENDPIHELKKTMMLGGLGAQTALFNYNRKELIDKFWGNKKENNKIITKRGVIIVK